MKSKTNVTHLALWRIRPAAVIYTLFIIVGLAVSPAYAQGEKAVPVTIGADASVRVNQFPRQGSASSPQTPPTQSSYQFESYDFPGATITEFRGINDRVPVILPSRAVRFHSRGKCHIRRIQT